MRFADRLIAATALEREQMAALYGADPNKHPIVPPGVDLDLFRPLPCDEARARGRLPPDHHMILFVGRIQPIKGIDTLIRAMARAGSGSPRCAARSAWHHRRRPTTRRPSRASWRGCKALRTELGIDDLVTFLGSRDSGHPGQLLHRGLDGRRAVASTSRSAWSRSKRWPAARPVIASDVGGLSLNVADGFNGYLVRERRRRGAGLQDRAAADARRAAPAVGPPGVRSGPSASSWQIIADETLAVYDLALGRTLGRLRCPT